MSGRGKGKKQLARLYKIEGNGSVYVGQTHQEYFSSRKSSHVCDLKRYQEQRKDSKKPSAFPVLLDEKPKFTILETVEFTGDWKDKKNKKIRELVAKKRAKMG